MGKMIPFNASSKHAPDRNELHLARRIFHVASGLGIAIVSAFLETKREFCLFLGVMTAADFVIEGARLIFPAFNRKVLTTFRSVLRQGEEYRLSGVGYYLLGCLIASIVFPRQIAVLAILFLAFGDPIASVVGLLVGRRRWPLDMSPSRKTLEGSLACFAFCAFVTYIVSFYFDRTIGLGPSDRFVFSFLGGASAALGEMLPLRTDDNFALPLIAGTTLWVTSAFFHLMPGLYF